MSMPFAVVVPWLREKQRDQFLYEWKLTGSVPDWLFLTQDKDRSGTAKTKNRGLRNAMQAGAEVLIVLDDDVYPTEETPTMEVLTKGYLFALNPQPVEMFKAVTHPPSRGTPYFNRTIDMPVAGVMSFWENVPDWDAPSQLVYGPRARMEFKRKTIFGRYFAWCGMAVAFRSEWWPYCSFVEDVGRMDDIWGGLIFQRFAYSIGHCFNLNGPMIRHSRQSNVWANLAVEAPFLESNESAWQRVLVEQNLDYESLLRAVKGGK